MTEILSACSASQPWELSHVLIKPVTAIRTATVATDIIYRRTIVFFWETIAVWLLTGGLLLAGVLGLACILDAALRRVWAVAAPLRSSMFLAPVRSDPLDSGGRRQTDNES